MDNSSSKSRRNRRSRKKIKKNNIGNGNGFHPPDSDPGSTLASDLASGSALLDADVGKREMEREQTLDDLAEAFASATMEEVETAYSEADEDDFSAAKILGEYSCSSGGDRKRMKKIVVSTGLVSDVIGKGYVNGSRRGGKCGFDKRNREVKGHFTKDDSMEFLTEMLGESCELDSAVIRDILGHCHYDVEMALFILLDMSASSNKQPWDIDYGNYTTKKLNYLGVLKKNSVKECANNNMQNWEVPWSDTTEKDIPQKILESIFNYTDTPKHEPTHMNWKKVVQELEATEKGFEFSSSDNKGPLKQILNGTGDSYHTLRTAASKHWDTMRSFYERASVAYSNGQRAHASYLSEQGRWFSKLAREADEKASRDIFAAKNKNIENIVTIDLHGQHVESAMVLLKVHVLILTYSPAIQLLKVITGCGTHGMGRGKLKQSVINFLEKEGINWSVENPGTLVVKVDRKPLAKCMYLFPISGLEHLVSNF